MADSQSQEINREKPHETEAAKKIEMLIAGKHFNQSTVDRLKMFLDCAAIIK